MLDKVVGAGKEILMCQADLMIANWIMMLMGVGIAGLLALLVGLYKGMRK